MEKKVTHPTLEEQTTGERIKRLRRDAGLSQDQLATKAGLSKSFISEIENDAARPRGPNLVRLAQALQTSLDYLMTGIEPESSAVAALAIPRPLASFAESKGLPFSHVAMLREMYGRIEARRNAKSEPELTEDDWERFYNGVKHLLPP